MLAATSGSAWLGYCLDRTKGRVLMSGLGDRVLLLGRQAREMANLFAFAGAEAGLKLTVLDLDGSVSGQVHGYFKVHDYRSMLYEAFHLAGEDATHGQLVASAYGAALDLNSEEEAILSATLQMLSEQNDLATPSSLFDAVGAAEGFRGFYVDKLKGRIGALKHLDATRLEDFAGLMPGGSLVSFASAPYPLAAELAALLYLAKFLHLASNSAARPDYLLVTAAHRLFRYSAKPQQQGNLMARLLEGTVPFALATPLPALMNDRLVECMPVRVYSSEAWNAQKEWKQAASLTCSFTICDYRSGATSGFVPRFVRPKGPNGVDPVRRPSHATPELTKTVLDEISRFDAANRQSVVSYLSPQFLAVDIGAEIDRLHSEGYLLMEPKQVGSGPRILAYTVTQKGRNLLRELGD